MVRCCYAVAKEPGLVARGCNAVARVSGSVARMLLCGC